jgi:hypothetical protein
MTVEAPPQYCAALKAMKLARLVSVLGLHSGGTRFDYWPPPLQLKNVLK